MNRTLTTLGLTLEAAIFTFQGAVAQTAPAAAPPGDAARGKAAYMSYGCYECHGTVGEGNYGTGDRIAPHPPPYALVLKQVRQPRADMPSFSEKILPEATLADIYAYLQSIPAGKPGSDQPLLSNTTLKPK